MALVNHAKREINAKIVVCGPASAGKSTLLKSICSILPVEERGALRSMTLQNDKMLFFDFTHPEGGDSGSYSIRFHVYTLTGQVSHENSWKMVLKGVDGIIFVADSDINRQTANRQAINQLRGALAAHGKVLGDIAAVAVCSKRDISGALPLADVSKPLDIDSISLLPVSPISGEGVLAALGTVVGGIVNDLQKLELTLQKPVMKFIDFAPDYRPEQAPGAEQIAAEASPGEGMAAPHSQPEPGHPSILISGKPEVDPSGVIRIPLKIGCCGSETTLQLSLSLVG